MKIISTIKDKIDFKTAPNGIFSQTELLQIMIV